MVSRATTSGPILTWIFNRLDIAAVTLPTRTIIYHPDAIDDKRIRNHELAHIRQIERDGPWTWAFLICWYVIRYGYTNSPYEIEAREAENIDVTPESDDD